MSVLLEICDQDSNVRTTEPGQVTTLLRQWRDGNDSALTELTPLIYSELRMLARRRLAGESRKVLSPTELVHEAFLRLVRQQQPEWANRSHFYYIAARLMRQILVDFIREAKAEKRGGWAETVSIENAGQLAAAGSPSLLGIHEALNRLARLDDRKARILEMRYFGGMTAEEIGEVENVSAVTVTREVRAATAWLRVFLSQGGAWE